MAKSVFCIAKTREQAETIVDRLKDTGFSGEDISVLMPDRSATSDFAHEKATKAPEGTVTGAGAGGITGGALGYLAGIGALTIPGVGPLIAAGPLMAALSGVALGGALGGVVGALVGMGIPEYEAKRYAGKVKEGNILLSVHTEDGNEISTAKTIFKKAGATDISTAGEEKAKDDDRETARRAREGREGERPPAARSAEPRPAAGASPGRAGRGPGDGGAAEERRSGRDRRMRLRRAEDRTHEERRAP